MKEQLCWKCGKSAVLPEGRLSFRATCDHCSAWLHCCRGCRHYAPGKPNDCAIPGTDQIADREAANLCDAFCVAMDSETKKGSLSDVAQELFGEKSDLSSDPLKDLFKKD